MGTAKTHRRLQRLRRRAWHQAGQPWRSPCWAGERTKSMAFRSRKNGTRQSSPAPLCRPSRPSRSPGRPRSPGLRSVARTQSTTPRAAPPRAAATAEAVRNWTQRYPYRGTACPTLPRPSSRTRGSQGVETAGPTHGRDRIGMAAMSGKAAALVGMAAMSGKAAALVGRVSWTIRADPAPPPPTLSGREGPRIRCELHCSSSTGARRRRRSTAPLLQPRFLAEAMS